MNVQSRFKCINDLDIDVYSYFVNQQPWDGLHCLLQRRTQRYSGKHFDIIKKKIEILSKIQASHSTAQYFKLAGGLAERVAAVLVIVIAVKRIITIIIIFIIIIVIAITIDPMIR